MRRQTIWYVTVMLTLWSGTAVNYGVSNPCTPHWVPVGWEVGPTIGMTAPAGPFKLCFSPSGVHVLVEAAEIPATPGKVAYQDINNCPQPGDPPVGWITPQTAIHWTVYLAPEGTIPTEGPGATADFHVFHAGFFQVQWRIVGHIDATSQNLEWHLEAGPTNYTSLYVRPEIVRPSGHPATDNQFLFSHSPNAPWPDGRCTINPEGVGADPDPWWFEWSLPDIYGCIKGQNPGASPHANPTLYYDRLPNSNAGFGNKNLTLTQQPAECSDLRTIQLFFSSADDARNHPGAGSGVTPNWFYYWRQTSATWGTPYWDPEGIHLAGICFSAPYPPGQLDGTFVAYISHAANDSIVIPSGPRKNETVTGIDYFAYACRHEQRHAVKMNEWGGYMTTHWREGTAWITEIDADHDVLPDALEPKLGPEAGGPYDNAKKITYPQDDMPDGHRYIFYTQQDWIPGSADSEDWGVPGRQWNQ